MRVWWLSPDKNHPCSLVLQEMGESSNPQIVNAIQGTLWLCVEEVMQFLSEYTMS